MSGLILQINTLTVNFGDVAAGQPGYAGYILTNPSTSGQIIGLGTPTITDPNFTMDALPAILHPRIPLAVSMTYNAPAAGIGPVSAQLWIFTSAANNPVIVTLTANIVAVGTPALSITPNGFIFPSTHDQTTSAPQAFTISNNSSTDLTISNIIIQASSPFASNDLPSFPYTVTAGSQLVFHVTYTPTGNGYERFPQAIEIDSNSPSSPTYVALGGIGAAITPAYIAINNFESCFAGFFGGILMQFDDSSLHSEEVAYSQRIFQFAPGMDNQVLQVEIQYEDLGECHLFISVWNERGDLVMTEAVIGTALNLNAVSPETTPAVRNQVIDIGSVSGEFLTVQLRPDGPFSLISYIPRYAQHGEVTRHDPSR